MARKSERKLFLFGKYSLALLPPKQWLTELGVEAGDIVSLEFDKSRRRIVIRLPHKSNAPRKVETKRNPKTQEDWEPILPL